MKKYHYSVLVMALFAIGFAASGDSESSGSKGSYAGTYAIEGGYKLPRKCHLLTTLRLTSAHQIGQRFLVKHSMFLSLVKTRTISIGKFQH